MKDFHYYTPTEVVFGEKWCSVNNQRSRWLNW